MAVVPSASTSSLSGSLRCVLAAAVVLQSDGGLTCACGRQLDMENSSDTQELDEKIFEIIDKDGDGTITVDELRAAILSMGEVMSYRDVVQLVREADKDGDGQIDLEEFVTMMRRHSRYSDHL